jgi:hypothetical protein
MPRTRGKMTGSTRERPRRGLLHDLCREQVGIKAVAGKTATDKVTWTYGLRIQQQATLPA